jgi:hypothetical protein
MNFCRFRVRSDHLPHADINPSTIEDALNTAYHSRSDLRAAVDSLKSSPQNLSAATGEHYPTLVANGNYGDLGPTLGHSHGDFSFEAGVRIPIFTGGQIKGDITQPQAEQRQRKAEAENLRGQVDYDVRTAFLNLNAAKEPVDVAQRNRGLANEMYLASDVDDSGPWLYSMDVERRIPHRLTSGLERCTSLAASADACRVVVTLANPKRTLWRLRLADSPTEISAPVRISLITTGGFSSRMGPDYLHMFQRPAPAKVSGSSPMELQRSCGAVRERESLAARRSPPMDGISPYRFGSTGRRFCTSDTRELHREASQRRCRACDYAVTRRLGLLPDRYSKGRSGA